MIPSQGYSKLLYLLIKSLQEVFGINRNLKQIRSFATDEKIKLNFKNVNIARESLQGRSEENRIHPKRGDF